LCFWQGPSSGARSSFDHQSRAGQNPNFTSYDKAILSLSSGALGITIAFADKFGGDIPVVTWAVQQRPRILHQNQRNNDRPSRQIIFYL
jgi:hypothetical protein